MDSSGDSEAMEEALALLNVEPLRAKPKLLSRMAWDVLASERACLFFIDALRELNARNADVDRGRITAQVDDRGAHTLSADDLADVLSDAALFAEVVTRIHPNLRVADGASAPIMRGDIPKESGAQRRGEVGSRTRLRRFTEGCFARLVPEFELCADDLVVHLEAGVTPAVRHDAPLLGFDSGGVPPGLWQLAVALFPLIQALWAYVLATRGSIEGTKEILNREGEPRALLHGIHDHLRSQRPSLGVEAIGAAVVEAVEAVMSEDEADCEDSHAAEDEGAPGANAAGGSSDAN